MVKAPNMLAHTVEQGCVIRLLSDD